MTIRLICLDADDTLWHNERHFSATREAMLARLAPFATTEVGRVALEECQQRNMRLYGYGAKSFTLSMIETAAELGGDAVSAAMLHEILDAGRALLSFPVELFDDVADTVDRLARQARVVLVTKGDLLHQEMKLASSGLGDRFGGVEIVSDKTAETFRRIFVRYGVAAHEAIMAGDSLRSDVVPALAAGAWAAFVPQPLQWSHEVVAEPVDQPRFHRLDRLGDLPALIDAIDAGEGAAFHANVRHPRESRDPSPTARDGSPLPRG